MNLFSYTELQPNKPIFEMSGFSFFGFYSFFRISFSLEVVCHVDTYEVMSARCSRKYCMEHEEKTNGLLKVAFVRRTGAVDMTCWSELLQPLP